LRILSAAAISAGSVTISVTRIRSGRTSSGFTDFFRIEFFSFQGTERPFGRGLRFLSRSRFRILSTAAISAGSVTTSPTMIRNGPIRKGGAIFFRIRHSSAATSSNGSDAASGEA
jgi:hypothetical protein